jgi:cell division protein FtsL
MPAPRLAPVPLPRVLPRFRWHSLRAAGFILLAGLALLVPVSLNMAATGAEYRFAQLQDRQSALKIERAALQTKVAALTAHQRVEAAAQKMGMVPGPHFEFLDMGAGDGAEGVAGSADSGSVR